MKITTTKFFYELATDKRSGLFDEIIKFFFLILSFVYGFIIRSMIFLYSINPYKANCKVISVGNITVGGTGKTTFVEYICKFLKSKGKMPVVISRGYKSKRNTDSIALSFGDEPYLLQQKLQGVPVISGADRVKLIKEAVDKYKADTVILDDGFQQWRIKKDLEIVMINAKFPFGNKKMLPAGILRQPLSTLKNADIFVFSKTNLSNVKEETLDLIKKIKQDPVIVQTQHLAQNFYSLKDSKVYDLSSLQKKKVALFCGIGDPDSFESIVKLLGAEIVLSFRFDDHHFYSAAELKDIAMVACEKGCDFIMTTEKDAIRIKKEQIDSLSLEIVALSINMQITENENIIYDRLLKLYSI